MITPIETDVFVVGGGPAGLAAALAARRSGFTVVLADRAQPPVDKACGEGLLPDGVAALRQLGIQLSREEAFPFRGIRFVDGELTASAEFPDQHGLGIRRTVLHRVLMESVQDAGVALHWRASVDCSDPTTLRLDGRPVRYRWLVGADGAQSRIRRWADLPAAWTGPRRMGLRQHYGLRPWCDLVEVYWHKDAQAYVTPIGPREVCIAVLGSEPAARLVDLPALFPKLAGRLAGAKRVGPLRGAMSTSTRLHSVTQGPIALVGDASGGVDAITGAGVSLALRQAVALGCALRSGDIGQYQTAHFRLNRLPLLMGRVLLFFGQRDRLRKRAMRALAANPRVFEHLLALHLGLRGPAGSLSDLFGFGWQLLSRHRTEDHPSDAHGS